MNEASVNLVDEPWIPVAWLDSASGEPDWLGLRELFRQAHRIRALRISEAPAHSALLRILYALTARITGLDEADSGDTWAERRGVLLQCRQVGFASVAEVLADAPGIDAYFDEHHDRFFLFHPDRPWMQDPRLPEQCDPENTAGVNKLVMSRAAGNNHSWFSHETAAAPVLPDPSQAVLGLLTWHYWGSPGRCSTRTVGSVSAAVAKAAPLRGALSYHPECDNLFETLLAGLVPDVNADRKTDLCPWEREELPDPLKSMPEPLGPCSRLTGTSQHAVYLVPAEDGRRTKDAYITWAYNAPRVRPQDDYLIWDVNKDLKSFAREAKASRALWRDVDALLLQQKDERSPKRPLAVAHAATSFRDLRIRALGFDQDMSQSANRQHIESVTPKLLLHVVDEAPETDSPVRTLREVGEEFGWRLAYGIKSAWLAYTDDKHNDPGPWLDATAERYWPAAEEEFWSRFRLLNREEEAWTTGFDEKATRRAFGWFALDSYNAVTDSVTRTPRGAKAVGKGRAVILAGLEDGKKTSGRSRTERKK
ncbi:type I-E CRISPR-associated protein Cse1/CasA [Streptomyces cacaoi]|uniref:type I-E CRISPR-associated protein Cse1/CasA n=1 Tax=Streptomyces cacaoi TaxID=1898 RepID=UPI00374967B6